MAAATVPDTARVGVDCIDADHIAIVALLDHLEMCASDNEDGATLGSALSIFCDFTEFHFGREETLMERAGFPDADGHRHEHREFLERLRGVRGRFEANPAMVSLRDVVRILRNWFEGHWERFDAPMGAACRDNVQASAAARDLRFGGQRAQALAGRRVMVVDDNANFRRLIEIALGAAGTHGVYGAASANEALVRLARTNLDLILVDWMMDGRDGLEFIQQLRRDGVAARMVLVTGFARPETASKAITAGANGFVEKPIGADALIGAAASALAG